MADVHFPEKISSNNGDRGYRNLLQKLNNVSEKSNVLSARLNQLNEKLNNLNNLKSSIMSRINTYKGVSADQQLTNNWHHVLQEIRKAQKEKLALQNERDKLGKKEQTLQTTRTLAFTQFKNKQNKPKIMESTENPYIEEFMQDLP